MKKIEKGRIVMFNKKKIMKRAILLGLVGGLFLAMTSYAAPKYVETDIVENKIKAALFSVSLDPGDGTINNSKDPYRIVSNDTNSKVSFPTASKDYYDFKGYALLGNSKATYDIPASGQLTGSAQEYNLPIKDDKGNSLNGTTLKAIFQPHKYTITCNLDGGSISNNPTNYNVESSDITLPEPTKTGYTFAGWTGSNGTTPQTSVTIPKSSYGDKSYTANWKANQVTSMVLASKASDFVGGNNRTKDTDYQESYSAKLRVNIKESDFVPGKQYYLYVDSTYSYEGLSAVLHVMAQGDGAYKYGYKYGKNNAGQIVLRNTRNVAKIPIAFTKVGAKVTEHYSIHTIKKEPTYTDIVFSASVTGESNNGSDGSSYTINKVWIGT